MLNRPYAFQQWIQKAVIPERYILMSEPDHVFLRPMPNFMKGDTPAAFPFFYIEPASKEHAPITQQFTGPLSRKELEQIAPIGNSPTFLSVADMKKARSRFGAASWPPRVALQHCVADDHQSGIIHVDVWRH